MLVVLLFVAVMMMASIFESAIHIAWRAATTRRENLLAERAERIINNRYFLINHELNGQV